VTLASPLLSDRHRMIGEAVRKFADERIRPQAQAFDEAEAFPAEIFREMAALGLFGITVPEAMGGAGADALAAPEDVHELHVHAAAREPACAVGVAHDLRRETGRQHSLNDHVGEA